MKLLSLFAAGFAVLFLYPIAGECQVASKEQDEVSKRIATEFEKRLQSDKTHYLSLDKVSEFKEQHPKVEVKEFSQNVTGGEAFSYQVAITGDEVYAFFPPSILRDTTKHFKPDQFAGPIDCKNLPGFTVCTAACYGAKDACLVGSLACGIFAPGCAIGCWGAMVGCLAICNNTFCP